MIEIGFNCPESLSDMTAKPGGFKCQSCRRILTDFRGMTNDGIKQVLDSNAKQICGVFNHDQLINPKSSKMTAIFRMAFIAVFIMGLSAQNLAAQNTTEVPLLQLDSTAMDTTANTGVIKGTVSADGEPLPFVHLFISVDGSPKYRGVTDFDGFYSITIPDEDVTANRNISLNARYVGYNTVQIDSIKIASGDTVNVNVKMEYDAIICGIIIKEDDNKHYEDRNDPYNYGKTVIKGDGLRQY